MCVNVEMAPKTPHIGILALIEINSAGKISGTLAHTHTRPPLLPSEHDILHVLPQRDGWLVDFLWGGFSSSVKWALRVGRVGQYRHAPAQRVFRSIIYIGIGVINV
jgi:hypothetical protein